MAEREGVEPPIRCRIPDFESGAFDHSAISPCAAIITSSTTCTTGVVKGQRVVAKSGDNTRNFRPQQRIAITPENRAMRVGSRRHISAESNQVFSHGSV